MERTLIRTAQAVVRRPALLLLDDPVLGLGIAHAETVLAQLRNAARTHATATLMTVAHPSEALHAGTVLTLNAGALIENPTSDPWAGTRLPDEPALLSVRLRERTVRASHRACASRPGRSSPSG